ncbi:beta strand repeat-containing protein [Kutzneria albida]|uniref:Chaplin domain-containing protein n=1 Tax=Kutzneria albida DSM 43870 TaxID=1449976 RepID=W5WN25_9PSEU|nr:chaplin family protein [Kutzneria albida]AHI02151.1 hypothetical protein KALB_8794 [Kutzneria albida DSM 43870]
MQTWAKRGFQAALVTGGLLVIGAGVANASEAGTSVNPLGVPTPNLADVNVKVPVHIDQNTIGTALGGVSTPAVDQTINTRDLTKSLQAHPLSSQNKNIAVDPGQNISRGNTIPVDVCIPIDISGNAIAATGNASSVSHSTMDCSAQSPTVTDGRKGSIAGNEVAVDLTAPVQITNNAIAALGNAEAEGSSTVVSHVGTTPIITSGEKGTLTGNVVNVAGAIPVQAAVNAIAVGGNAESRGSAHADTAAGSVIRTDGKSSTLGGNVVAVPVGLPVEANGNGIAFVGNGDAASKSGADVLAGDNTELGWIHTNGDPATGAGNIVQAPIATKVLLAGNAIAGAGNTIAKGLTENNVEAGGTSHTDGTKSTISGNLVDPEVALPVEVFGNGVTAIGTAAGSDINKVTMMAGGDTYTVGDKSTLGGNDAVAPIAGAADVFGSGASLLGNASGTASNDSKVNDGGYNGTLGNDAVGGGNIAFVPVALPAEVFGAGGSLGGNADGLAKEVKDVEAGHIANTNDDRGTVSSNIAAVPVSAPVQVFGDAVGWVANVSGTANSDTTSTAGNATHANGAKGSASGNIAQVPVSLPTQLFGDTANLVGNGDAIAKGVTTSVAGGGATTDGHGGAITGNVADVPVAGAIQGTGLSAAAGAVDNALASNMTSSTAGGADKTTGEFGSVAGNLAQVPAAPVVQVFGDAVSAAGIATAKDDTKVWDTAGKDAETSGVGGGISGNVARVPAAATAAVFGDSVTAGGLAASLTKGYIDPSAGGDTTTSGALGSVSGNVANVPGAVNAAVNGDAVGAAGNAASDATAWTGNFAGGVTKTDGHFSAVSGNIAQVPYVADAQVLADSVAAAGQAGSKSALTQISTAGGDSATSGLAGSLAGDVVSVPAAVNAEVVHDAVGGAGNAFQAGNNKTADLAGGDIFTNGLSGSGAGDIVQVPVAGVAQVFGDAASVVGITGTGGTNLTDVATAGRHATAGASNTLSGVNGNVPAGVVAQIVNVPLRVLGQAVTHENNLTSVTTSNEHALVDLPVSGQGLMGARELPSMGGLSILDQLVHVGELAKLPGGAQERDLPGANLLNGIKLPGVPAAAPKQERDLPSLSGVLPGAPEGAQLLQLPKTDGIKVIPHVAGM